MSNRFKQPQTTIRGKKIQWMNLLTHCHDVFCECDNPITHTITLIFEQEKEFKFTPQERDLIQSCLTGETTGTDHGDKEEDVFGDGVLEDLFKESTGDDEDTR